MWVHQAGLADRPALQWRALGPVAELAPGDEEARLAILRILSESPQPLLRQRAAEVADFPHPLAVSLLVRAATRDREPRVRRAAVHTLLQHSAREQFEPGGAEYEAFLTRLGVEPSPAVRKEIEELLELENP